MRTDDIAFLAQNTAPFSSPRYVVELSFAFDNSVLYYLTSHAGTPTPNPTNTLHDVVEKVAGTSQKLDVARFNATIGNLSVDLTDVDEAVTDLLRAQDVAGRALTKKRMRVYMGFDGADFSDYALIQTQIIQNVEYQDGGYRIAAQDVQRETRAQIFEVRETALGANIAEGASSITVQSTAGFEMVVHSAGWKDMPSATVGYLYIENNDDWAIACYTGKTSTAFTGVTWTSFGARARQFLIVDGDQENEITVRELVYLELPAVKMAYALLTGTLYGQAGAFLPKHWHCGIAAQYLSTSHFVNIGADLWVTDDDARGPKLRFLGVSNEDGRNFIQQEILPAINCFMPVLSTGELALKRLQAVLSTSATVARLNADNVVSAGAVKYAHEDIANKYRIDWAWDFHEERFRRSNLLYDNPSIDKHGASEPKVLELKGLHGSVHSPDFLRNMFDGYRDRYAGAPITVAADLLPKMNTLEVGDVVHVDLSHLPDYTGTDTLARAMEVQQVKIDWLTGRVSVDLFGSTAKASPLTEYGDIAVGAGNAIADSWYSKNGINIETAFAGSVSRSGSTVTLTADITLTGGDLLAFFGVLMADCVFYVLGDFEIPAGRTVRIVKNVCLKVRGFFTVDGVVDGAGRGPAGGDHRRWSTSTWVGTVNLTDSAFIEYAPADVVVTGYPLPLTGLVHESLIGCPAAMIYPAAGDSLQNSEIWASNVIQDQNAAAPVGHYASIPALTLDQGVPASATAYLAGLPAVAWGGGGRAGGSLYRRQSESMYAYEILPVVHGADGGAGGAGFVCFARGMDFGPSGRIDISGVTAAANQQQAGNWTVFDDTGDGFSWPSFFNVPSRLYASAASGGSPGCAYIFIDGIENVPPIVSAQTIVANYGAYQHLGVGRIKTRLLNGELETRVSELGTDNIELLTGSTLQHPSGSQWLAHSRVQVLAAPTDPVDDTPVEADAPLTISLTEHTNTPVTPEGNKSSIDVSVTPPSDANYSYAWAQYRKLGDTAWTRIPAPAQTETTFTVATDGATYQVQAISVSKSGVVARTGPIAQITVTDFADNPAAVRAAGAAFDLRVAGQAVGTNTFNTRDLVMAWSYRSALGIDFVLDDWFHHFRVTVRNGGTTLATYEAHSPNFTLPVELNALINGGTPFAAITVDVRQVTADGTAGTAATVTFTNPAPAAVVFSSINTAPSDYGTVVRWANPAVADLLRVELHISQISGFTPSAGTRYFSGLAEAYTAAALHPNTPHYGQIRVVDVYSNASSYTAFSFTTADVDPDLKNENQNWSDVNDDDGTMPAPNADVTADSPAHQALESAVADLEQQVASLGGTGFNLALPAYGNFEGSPALTVANGTAVASSEAFRFQAKSLKVTPSAADCSVCLGTSSTNYNTPFSPNSKWIISVYVMAPVGTTVAVQMHLRAANGTLYSINGTTSGTAGTWTRIYGLVDLSSNASDSCVLRLDNDGGSGVVVYFDALQLERYVGSDSAPPPSAYKDPIENVANSAAFQALSQTVTNQGTTITSHTSQLSGINSTLTTKADQSWVNTQIAAASPDALSDIDAAAATKLAGISPGADVTATSTAMTSVQGTVASQGGTLATHTTQLTTLNDSLVLSRQATANMLPNGLLTSEASDGRPANVFAAYTNSVPGTVAFLDATNKTGLKLASASDTTIGAAFGAIPVVGGQQMVLRIRYKASVAAGSGFYFRMQEYDGVTLPAGTKFISGSASTSEAGGVEATRDLAHLVVNQAITTSWQSQVLVYTPTATAKWASPLFLNWTGMGTAELHVDYCLVIPNAIQVASAQASQLLDQRITATEAGVTSVSQSVTDLSNSVTSQFNLVPAAIDAAIETADLALYAGAALAAQDSARRIAFRCDNNTASVAAWFKLLEFTVPTPYSNAGLSGRVRYGASSRYEASQDLNAGLTTGSPINAVSQRFQLNNSPPASTYLRMFRVDNGTTNQKFVVYVCMPAFSGMEAVLDVAMTNSASATVAVWQRGVQVSIGNTSYLPAGTELSPVYNRGMQDGADVTASSSAHTALVSRVGTAEGAITSIASSVLALDSRIDDAEASVDVVSETVDGVQAHHTVNVQAASDGISAVTGLQLLANAAGSAPVSQIRLAADQIKFIRSLSQPGTEWALTYDSALARLTVPSLSVGDAQIANVSVSGGKLRDVTLTNSKFVDGTLTGVKLVDATLTRAKLVSGTLGAFYQVNNNVSGNGTTWANLLTLTADSPNVVAATVTVQGLEAGATQFLVIEVDLKYHLVDPLFNTKCLWWEFNPSNGVLRGGGGSAPSFLGTVKVNWTSNAPEYLLFLSRGHFTDLYDASFVKGVFYTQNVVPQEVPRTSQRIIVGMSGVSGDAVVSLLLRCTGQQIRANNIGLSVNLLKF